MPDPSLHAQLCDLLGEDPNRPKPPPRPTIAQARRRCRPGHVMACRQGKRALVLVVRQDGSAAVAPDRCPHDGGPLSDGFIDDNHLVCARHGWEFDLANGTCVGAARPAIKLTDVR